jgi:hypothetical protein
VTARFPLSYLVSMADKSTPSTPRPYSAIQAMLGVTHRSSAEVPLRLPSEDGLFPAAGFAEPLCVVPDAHCLGFDVKYACAHNQRTTLISVANKQSHPLVLLPARRRQDRRAHRHLVDRGAQQTRDRRDGTSITPTPTGLFATSAPGHHHPNAFLGSWILALIAHSNVPHEFDRSNGRICVHGRGGSSLLAPGTNRSHGCIRLANTAIDWLVHAIGRTQLPGTPVQIH